MQTAVRKKAGTLLAVQRVSWETAWFDVLASLPHIPSKALLKLRLVHHKTNVIKGDGREVKCLPDKKNVGHVIFVY